MRVQIFTLGRDYHKAIDWPNTFELPNSATVQDALRALSAVSTFDPAASSVALVSVSGHMRGTIAEAANDSLADGDEILLITPVAGG